MMPQAKYLEKMVSAFGPAAKAASYRNSAAYFDRLASVAAADGDGLDAAECRAKAAEFRKRARRCEAQW